MIGRIFPKQFDNASWRGHWLAIWFLVTFVPAIFARDLTDYSVFGWPFPFWVAAFGAPLTYLFVIWYYAWRMDHLDEEARLPGQDE